MATMETVSQATAYLLCPSHFRDDLQKLKIAELLHEVKEDVKTEMSRKPLEGYHILFCSKIKLPASLFSSSRQPPSFLMTTKQNLKGI